ncbi:MAG: TonB-dependent receptor, partial [Fulvivirga sp.]
MPNMNLDFTKARHYVVGYENKLGENLLLKMEAYYQDLYNIPVEDLSTSSYSLINQVEWFTDRKVVNEGTGKNYGLELTLERYFDNNYFFLMTASLFDSKYRAMDNIERNTAFNGNYVGNFLFGKEFEISRKLGKKKVIGFNSKVSLQGARRYTPMDIQASIEQDEAIYYESEAFSKRGDDLFMANISVVYRIDRKKTSQELKLDIQNVTNNQARLDQYYDSDTKSVEYGYQLALLPVLTYTIHF